jgi:hypothetical protein
MPGKAFLCQVQVLNTEQGKTEFSPQAYLQPEYIWIKDEVLIYRIINVASQSNNNLNFI